MEIESELLKDKSLDIFIIGDLLGPLFLNISISIGLKQIHVEKCQQIIKVIHEYLHCHVYASVQDMNKIG